MCTICEEMRPWSEGCDLAEAASTGSSGPAAGKAAWSLGQIADFLVTGYWGVSAPRAFDVGSGGTLSYDVGGLSEEAREVARAALDEWSIVTGIEFVEASGGWAAAAVLREAGDAGDTSGTAARAAVNTAFEGSVGEAGDRDWVRVTIDPGQTVTITLAGMGGDGLSAPEATLRNARGYDYGFGWDTAGDRTSLTVAVTGGPITVYVDAGASGGAVGDYRLELRDPDAGQADITFDDAQSGAFASFRSRGDEITTASVNVSQGWVDAFGGAVGSYGFQTYLHEIGHALGLGHAGRYNGSADYGRDALYANDSWQATVMSYFDQRENAAVTADRALVVTPMAADIEAMRVLYGQADVREGDTTYGEGSTAGGALDLLAGASGPMAFTILDTGGRDHLNLVGQQEAQRVDLRQEAASDVFGHRGNMVIASGTVIEDVTVGNGDDAVVGNDAANLVKARGGRDTVDGGAGDDAIYGGWGSDRLSGGEGRDRIHGGGGHDVMEGGEGADRLYGGSGDDVMHAQSASDGEIDWRNDQLFGGAGDDRLIGGKGRDRLSGDAGDDRIEGGRGDDKIIGGAGDDALAGGGGADVFVFKDGFGRDVIEDFAAGLDVLDLRAVTGLASSAADLVASMLAQDGDDVVLDAGDQGVLTLAGTALDAMSAGDVLL